MKSTNSAGMDRQMHQGGASMLWTIFKSVVVVWMLQMLLHFGVSAIHLVVILSLAALLLGLILHYRSFSSGGLHCAGYNQLTPHIPEVLTKKKRE
jgi:hypothetical protein